MPRTIKNFPYTGNRIPSPEEMLQIIQEQRRFIDNLKSENYKLTEQIKELKSDRCVAHIMGFAQKNAEEYLRSARQEAEGLVSTAMQRAKKSLDEVDGYVERILDTEDSLEGMLEFLKQFREHMLEADEMRMQEGIASALKAEAAGTMQDTAS